MVYVVVDEGFAITVLPVDDDNDDAGDQTYEAAPDAVIDTESPVQRWEVSGDITRAGSGLTRICE